jgi:hypothetical protein
MPSLQEETHDERGRRMSRVLLALLCLVVVIVGAWFYTLSRCSWHRGDINNLVGKSEPQVVEEMGSPDGCIDIDTAILNPANHSAEQIEQWNRSTPTHGYRYGGNWKKLLLNQDEFEVLFNVYDTVVVVRKR